MVLLASGYDDPSGKRENDFRKAMATLKAFSKAMAQFYQAYWEGVEVTQSLSAMDFPDFII